MGKSGITHRIIKNASFLYIRMIVLVLVNLYTSRVILQALGFDDFAIYAVVGGIVALFAVISNTLSASISRFIVYELGKGDTSLLQRIFCTSVIIQLLLVAVIVLLAETIGLWYVKSGMVYPIERHTAVNVCYQLSVFTFCVNLLSIPYNASIIAHERMSAFAYISLLEAFGQLTIALLISHTSVDRLICYSMSLAILALCVRIVYVWFCKRNFKECTFKWHWDIKLIKDIFAFAGWNMIGAAAGVTRDQGYILLVNAFSTLTANAAMALAIKVNGLVVTFIQNFMTALNPQITKSYARGEFQHMFNLTFQGTRFSFYLLLLIAVPLMLNTELFLGIWLVDVPAYTSSFVRLTILLSLSECLSYALITIMLATGDIRNYQIVVGGGTLLNVPVSYVCLYLGAPVQTILIVSIVLSQFCLAARLYLLRRMVGLDIARFLRQVYLNTLSVGLLAGTLAFWLNILLQTNMRQLIIGTACSIIIVLLVEFFVGASYMERLLIKEKVRYYIKTLFPHDR